MPPKKKKKEKLVRLQFDFTEKAVEGLDYLVNKIGVRTRAAVLRRAIALYSDLYREYEEAKDRKARLGFLEKDGTFSRVVIHW